MRTFGNDMAANMLAPRGSVGAMHTHLRHLSGVPGWRERNEEQFRGHEGLKFFVYHPLDYVDQEPALLGSNRLRANVGDFMSRSGLTQMMKPERAKDLETDLGQKMGFAYYRQLNPDLQKGVSLDQPQHMPQSPADFSGFVGAMQKAHSRPPTLGGVINSYDPLMTRQEIVASFGYGDRTMATEMSFLQAFQLSDFHQFVDAHERFHGSFTLKLEHAYHGEYFSGKARDMVQTAQQEKAQRVGGEWSTPYGKYIEENTVDCAAMLLHLKEGGDPAFIRAVADMRASRLAESADFDHDSADTLYALADKAEDPAFAQMLKNADTHELTDAAVRITAEVIRPKDVHYGMMKYAAQQRCFSDSKCAELIEEVERHTKDYEYLALPSRTAKDEWHAIGPRAEQAQDRLEDSDEKFARCVSFFPEMADMTDDQQEAFMIEVEERALMGFVTQEYTHLNTPTGRKLVLEDRLARLGELKTKDMDTQDCLDIQKNVLRVMVHEEELLMELDELKREDASYGTREGEAHFFRSKLRAAAACERVGEAPAVEPFVIEGLMERRLSDYPDMEPVQEYAQERQSR